MTKKIRGIDNHFSLRSPNSIDTSSHAPTRHRLSAEKKKQVPYCLIQDKLKALIATIDLNEPTDLQKTVQLFLKEITKAYFDEQIREQPEFKSILEKMEKDFLEDTTLSAHFKHTLKKL